MNLFIDKLQRSKKHKNLSFSALVFNTSILFVTFVTFVLCFLNFSAYNFDFTAVYEYREKFFKGFLNTILISFFSLILSIIFSLILASFSFSQIIILRMFAKFYTELIRGTPFLVQILIFYYIIADSLGLENRYIAGVVILSLFSCAYISEIFRAGILSVSNVAYENAKALGLKEYQIYLYVIFPQAFKNVLPPLSGQFANLIKDSSLLSIIALNELTQSAQEINSYTFSTLEAYIPLAFCYLLLTLPIAIFSRYLESFCQK
ncbi:amino acid ABC transporter permease [Campylobacter sp. US33a]|uniref:Amino acid ABC transporter permease n=1 Tax=Campylobacter sp. CCS1377 TaxID=3158229 RepID=A0AAU7EAD1_9BACT|nr:amino acid ABC transporter permease [Campylobacter sp. US33a]MCW1361076.1 amino acid ABC transporter permease [Campylobacter jejuni]TEY00903.1 amino acid ABC transporter permease [Campylobacter sp. US33a]